MADHAAAVDRLLDRHGQTFAQEMGIVLRDTPDPLFQLLCGALLLGTNINSAFGITAVQGLAAQRLTNPRRLLDAHPETVMTVLAQAKYGQRVEQTAARLSAAAERTVTSYDGDLRQLRATADGDVDEIRSRLSEFKGVGPVAAGVYLREVQLIWREVRPFVDRRAAAGARALGLPVDPTALAQLVPGEEFARLVAALVRVDLAGDADQLLP